MNSLVVFIITLVSSLLWNYSVYIYYNVEDNNSNG